MVNNKVMPDLTKVHDKAVKDLNKIMGSILSEREQCLTDRRFYSIAGAQWEGGLQAQYINKPKFEINKVHLSVLRIINEYRNNRITVDFIAKDGAETDLSDTCDGLYRADEQYSNADEAYDNAFEEAVGGGFGAWRLVTDYEDHEDPENEHQRILIEPIYEADSTVFFDLDARRQDKADAEYCFVLHPMDPEAFHDEYPNASPVARQVEQEEFDWSTTDVRYVAEYYIKEKKKEKLYVYEYLDGSEIMFSDEDAKENPEAIEDAKAMGARFVREKKMEVQRVRKYILGGNEVLEDHGYIAGRHIPIVPVFGKRWFIDNVERCCGHVRYQKDAQRLYNMQTSRLGEIAALSPIEKPIMAQEQVAGLENEWSDDNVQNYPYLPVNPITDSEGNEQYSGPLGYTKPPQVPPALVGLIQTLNTDMQELMGRPEAGEELGANLSGKAIELVQNRLDMQSYVYMDNMKKAMQRCGQIWLSIARELYVEKGRQMKSVDRQNNTESVTLMELDYDEDGIGYNKHDLTKANFEVYASVGPSSISRKESTIRSLMAMMQVTSDPQDMQVLSSMAMLNMEGEGIEDVREYYRKKLVEMGVVKPNKQEQQAMAEAAQNPAPPGPQEILLQAAAQKEQALAAKAQADAQKTQIETLKTAAEIDETVADTAKTYADIEEQDREFALEMARAREAAPLMN